jgi:alpha-ribazole phosphatase
MQLYLIRHPRPINAEGLCYGRRDIPVDPESVARAAAGLRDLIPEKALEGARIYSSPASRCVLLARALAAPREPRIAKELWEMSFGSWEGQAWDCLPRDELDAWARDVWCYRPAGAESAAMVEARWQRWVRELRLSGDDSAIAVTHAGVIRVALVAAGVVGTAAFFQTPVEFGSVHRVDLAQSQVPA